MLFDWCDFCQGSILRSLVDEFNDAAWKKDWLATPTYSVTHALRLPGYPVSIELTSSSNISEPSSRASSVDSSETSPGQEELA
jgi:hypothetical protein